jgi:hypothetical protein
MIAAHAKHSGQLATATSAISRDRHGGQVGQTTDVRTPARRQSPIHRSRHSPVHIGRKCMARFMDVHSGLFGVTEQQLAEAHQRDLDIEADEGVHFERAWLDPEAGKVFCLASGPSKEAVMRIHERAGHPTAEVYELSMEV